MGVLTTLMAAGNTVPGSWTIANARYNPPSAWKYDVSKIGNSASSTLDMTGVETGVTGVFFKPDGTKLYVIGSSIDGVSQYNLSSAWDITTATFSNSISFVTQSTAHTDLFISSDGLNLYTSDSTNDSIHQYSLSTAWSSSTATFVRSLSITAKETSVTGIHFKPDGTKMFIIGSASDSVHEYALSTAWNISTATFTQSLSVSAKATSSDSLRFTDNGLNMYILNAGVVHQYTLSTAWNISTATFTVTSGSVASSGETGETGIYVSEYGHLFCCGSYNDSIYLNAIGAYDITAATSENNANGIFVSQNGLNIYVIGSGNDNVYQFSLSSKNDLSTISYVGLFHIGTQEITPTDLYLSQDGTKLFIVGSSSDAVHKYTLSTPFTVSTAVFSQTFSVSSQETGSQGLHFSPNGIYMYVMGTSGDDVNQYTLGTAWDLSTASYTRVKDISANSLNPASIRFKPDGKKMFTVIATDKVVEYSLSTAWDVSTATYVGTFNVLPQSVSCEGIAFSSDGSVMFISDSDGQIFQYSVRS